MRREGRGPIRVLGRQKSGGEEGNKGEAHKQAVGYMV